MKALHTLIKLEKKKLDRILVDVSKSEEEKSLLIKQANTLAEETNKEIEVYYGSDYSFMLEQYLDNARKNQTKIKAQINRLEVYIEKLRQRLTDQYSELKKYEIALQNKQKQEYLKAQKAETKSLDEFAANKYVYGKR